MLTSSLSRYGYVVSILQKEIEQGKYPLNSALPSENFLAERFEVSRHTIREALRRLRELGLISSLQGSGSWVNAIKVMPRYLQSLDSYTELKKIADLAERKILYTTVEKLDAKLCEQYKISPRRKWLHVLLLWISKESSLPLILTDLYIDIEFSDIKSMLETEGLIINKLIEFYNIDFAKIKQNVEAMILNQQQAEYLQAETGQAALKLVRRYHTLKNKLVVFSSSISPSTRYTYTTEFNLLNNAR